MKQLGEKILILGAGKMVEAILQGWSMHFDLSDVLIYSPSGTSAKTLAEKFRAQAVTDFAGLKPQLVMIGCKPQQLKDLKKNLGSHFSDALFISVLAALSEKTQRDILNVAKLIRVMPNLPVKIQKGVSLLSSQSATADLPRVQKLFLTLGLAPIVSENELEELTLLTGSGPAFFYEFTQNLAQSFSSLTQEQREELARMVLFGAGLSAQNEKKDLSSMISEVTSKGGVTIAVLESLRQNHLARILVQGMEAGKKRSLELKKLILES